LYIRPVRRIVAKRFLNVERQELFSRAIACGISTPGMLRRRGGGPKA
jgi:hypothetical protein